VFTARYELNVYVHFVLLPVFKGFTISCDMILRDNIRVNKCTVTASKNLNLGSRLYNL
jgi:hypothetical protein